MNKTVVYNDRRNLMSWALHKQPGDITMSDLMNPTEAMNADVMIHQEGGVSKVIKGEYQVVDDPAWPSPDSSLFEVHLRS